MDIGILAGSHGNGLNNAAVRAANRITVRKLTEELGTLGKVLVSAANKEDYCDICPDVMGDGSALEGLYNLIKSTDEQYIFVCGSDMPMVSAELVEYMTQFICSDYDCYCITDEKHIHPLCAIYSKAMLPFIEKALAEGDFKLINLLKRARTKYIDLKYTCFDERIVKNTVSKVSKPPMPQVVFCVSGTKNTGKTWLITKLINEFIRDGYSVGAIKHDGHEYTIDHVGTDTYRFAEAGAETVGIFSDSKFSVIGQSGASAEALLEYYRGVDVVIIEGLKDSPYPKVEMNDSLSNPVNLICKATDIKSPQNIDTERIPSFERSDVQGIFSCIKKYFDLEKDE